MLCNQVESNIITLFKTSYLIIILVFLFVLCTANCRWAHEYVIDFKKSYFITNVSDNNCNKIMRAFVRVEYTWFVITLFNSCKGGSSKIILK